MWLLLVVNGSLIIVAVCIGGLCFWKGGTAYRPYMSTLPGQLS